MKNIDFKIFIIILVLFCPTSFVFAQSNQENEPPIKRHSPRRATLYSTFLPGLGQVYNKKYWKIPVVYAGLGVCTYLAIDNNNEFNRYKNAYVIRKDGEQDEFFGILNEQALLNEMDRWRKLRDYSIIGIAAFYVLQIIDANVDAHLYHFDISDDLSLKVFPAYNQYLLTQPITNLELKIVMTF